MQGNMKGSEGVLNIMVMSRLGSRNIDMKTGLAMKYETKSILFLFRGLRLALMLDLNLVSGNPRIFWPPQTPQDEMDDAGNN